MNNQLMRSRAVSKQFLTIIIMMILVFGFRNNIGNHSIDDDSTDKIPQTQEELDELMEELDRSTVLSEEEETEIRKNLKVPFSGFIENVGQKSNLSLRFYYATDESFIAFETSKVRIKQQIIVPISDNKEKIDPNEMKDPEFVYFDFTFPGSNLIEPVARFALKHSTNYFIGTGQFTGINSYEEIWFYNLFSGIDLRYFMGDQGLKYEFIVHPGGNPNEIAIQVSDTVRLDVSLDKVSIYSKVKGNKNIDLEIIADTDLFLYYDNHEETKNSIISSFKLLNAVNQTYGFEISDYEKDQVLVIDPVLRGFSTVIGGDGDDWGLGIAIDSDGNVYISGHTQDFSNDFPTTSVSYDQTHNGLKDVFITKLNSVGNGLIYSTFIGGNADDFGSGIVVDIFGNAYITGYTWSSTTLFPTTSGAFDQTHNGYMDVFVTKINAAGNALIYSTFIGGSNFDEAYGIAIDGSGYVYITGYTAETSSGFPVTPNAFDQTRNGLKDVFVTKINVEGNALVYSTFIGGNGDDRGYEIEVDSSGNVYITGSTLDSTIDFPTTPGAFDQTHNGLNDVFVTKLNADGNGLVYSTFMGGSSTDIGYGIAVDSSGIAYITGSTLDSTIDFPTTPGAFDQTHNGLKDVFVTKLNADGNGLVYSTYLGGNGFDNGYAIEIDSSGSVYITGVTQNSTTNFPTTFDAYNKIHNGFDDVFFTKLNEAGNALVYSTFIGGNGLDNGFDIAIDGYNNVYLTGFTSNSTIDFPTTSGVYDQTHNGLIDAFITKLSFEEYSTFIGGNGDDTGYGIVVDSSGNIYITGITMDSIINFPTTSGAYNQTHSGTGDVFVIKLNTEGSGLVYSTFIGGGGVDAGIGISVDGSGNTYIIGTTQNSTIKFPTTPGAFNQVFGGGIWDVFVTKLNPNGDGLVYSTFIGGSDVDFGNGIVVDSAGNAYITGSTRNATSNFPTTPGAFDQTHNGGFDDVFVTKLNAAGDGLVYSTFIGGSGSDSGRGIAVDGSGNAFITGHAGDSTIDFPTTPGAFDRIHDGGTEDVFVTKLNAAGNGLIYSTFLGGSGSDSGRGIAIDGSGSAFITGYTRDSTIDFPTTSGAFDQTQNGFDDVFVTKLNSAGDGLVYSTFLGGSSSDVGNGIVIDSSGNTYITGYTRDSTTDFPTTPGAFSQIHNGFDDAFVTGLNTTGNGLVYSTYLGGSSIDVGNGIVIDGSGDTYITGYTQNFTTNFPTTFGSFDQTHNGFKDIFITSLNVTGNGLITTDFAIPEINHPLDKFHRFGETGRTITWIVGDRFPDIYNLTLDGVSIALNLIWDNGTIITPVGALDGLGIGIHIAIITVYDKRRNLVSDTVYVIIDGTDPEIISTPNILYYQPGDTGNTLSWVVGDNNPNSYNITLDGTENVPDNPWINGSIVINVDGLSEGSYIYIITIVDKAGNYNTHSVTVTVIGTIPDLNSPSDIYYQPGATSNTISWVLGSQYPDYYNITLDGSIHTTNTTWTSSTTVGIFVDGLAEGSHIFIITIVDKAGNFGQDTVLVIVDGTVPIIVSPLDVGYSEFTYDHTITWNLFDLNPNYYTVDLDGSEFQQVTSWENGSISVDISGLSVGTYIFTISVFDKAENSISDPVIVIVIDTTIPEIDSTADFSYGEFSTGNMISWIIGDKYPGVYNITRNNTPFSSTTSWTNGSVSVNIDGLGLGGYEFIITVYDAFGNSKSDMVVVTVIDDKNPTISKIDGIEEGATVSGSILIEVSPNDEHGIKSVEFNIDDTNACREIEDTICDQNNEVFKLTLDTSKLNDGTHSLQIVVTDNAGNTYNEEILFTIQNKISDDRFDIPPTITVGIIAIGGLGLSGGLLRIRQRRRMDKAFDDLETDFGISEATGEGKNE